MSKYHAVSWHKHVNIQDKHSRGRLACSHSWFRNVNFAQPPTRHTNAIILSMTRCAHVLEHMRAQWYTCEWCSKIEWEADTKPRAPCCAERVAAYPS
jgi:hypothetical protein